VVDVPLDGAGLVAVRGHGLHAVLEHVALDQPGGCLTGRQQPFAQGVFGAVIDGGGVSFGKLSEGKIGGLVLGGLRLGGGGLEAELGEGFVRHGGFPRITSAPMAEPR